MDAPRSCLYPGLGGFVDLVVKRLRLFQAAVPTSTAASSGTDLLTVEEIGLAEAGRAEG